MDEKRSLITPAQAAARLGVCTRTVSRYAVRGKLTRVYSPTNTRIPRYDEKEVAELAQEMAGFRPAPVG